MPLNAVYRHTNIVAKDWRRLVAFYQNVFGCRPIPPERNYSGDWLYDCVRIRNCRVNGVHLLMPGYGDRGPTLEIFSYQPEEPTLPTKANRPGFAHIAFSVDDVAAGLKMMLENGGGQLGDVITMDVPDAGTITLVYATDPEGNIVELQKWT